MTTYYHPSKTFMKAFWAALRGMLLGAVTGALGVLQPGGTTSATVSVTAVVIGALTGALLGLKNYATHRSKPRLSKATGLPPVGPVVILGLIAVAATFSGCLTLPSLSPNGQSGNTLVAEKDVKPDGAQHFKIAIKQHGEATKEGTIDYSSGGPDPATFRIAGNASVDSSRLKPLLEGEGAALAKLPETIAGLMDVLKAIPDAAPGTPGAGLKEQIIKAFIERMLGRVLTPGGGQ